VSQTSAVCNAVTVFLDACLASANAHTRDIALSHQTWMDVFEVYMIRFEDARVKQIKQVLSCLVKILKNHPDDREAVLIRAGAVNAIMSNVMLREPRARPKPCIVALEHLIRESVISPFDLMSLFYDWLVAHHERWRPLLGSHCECLSIDTTRFVEQSSTGYESDEKVQRDVSLIFNLGLLIHGKNQAYTTSVGSLLAAFSKKASLKAQDQQILAAEFSLSMSWIYPVRHIMLEAMDCLEPMSNNLLHPLFVSSPSGFRYFINQLPIQSLLSGDMKEEGNVDEFTLLFAALRVAKQLALVHEDSK
jgi:hypothetical protein